MSRALGGAVTLALLVGCTAGDEGPVAAPSPSGPTPPQLVRAAALTTDLEGSSRYTLTTATTVNGAEVVLTGEGMFDWTADRGETTYDVPVGTVLQRLLGPDLYLSLPQQPKVFFKLKTADVAASPVGGTVEPTAQLHTLAAVAAAEVVGQEEVRGEPTTHYRGTYDVARALRGARGLQQAALRSSLGAASSVTEAPYDVYLDDDGRLRRLQQTVEVPIAAADGEESALTVTTTLELYDFGIDVMVVPPAADRRRAAPRPAAARRRSAAGGAAQGASAAGGVPAPDGARIAMADRVMGTVGDLLRIKPGTPVQLAGIDPRSTPGTAQGKEAATAQTAQLGGRLAELQERLYASGRFGDPRRILLVLQGMDTSGKGGAIKHVVGMVNPAGVRLTGFGKPTEEERAHDFLWRIEKALPPPGAIGVFDRSHYEDVLVVRVHDLVPPQEWQGRYDRINAWEAGLVEQGITMVKVMLHLSREEQRERLLARLDDPTKHWKVNPGDIVERGHWDAYQSAYEAALSRCSTAAAPWYVVPADRKWYRNWALAHLLLETLEAMDPQWPQPELDLEGMRAALSV